MKEYFKEEDLELTNDKLIELKKSIKVAERKYNILFAILSFVLKNYIIFENNTHKLTNYYFHGHIQLLHNQTHN